MPEMLKPSSALMGYGLGKDIVLLTDGRFSGGSHGFLIGHIVPEAAERVVQLVSLGMVMRSLSTLITTR